MNYDNKETPLTNMGELMWRASRATMARVGELVLNILDHTDEKYADRINDPSWEWKMKDD